MKRTLVACIITGIAWAIQAASPIEGDWIVNNSGVVLRFVRASEGTAFYDILWIDGPDLSILPGTKVGSATATPDLAVYDCSVVTDPRGSSDKKRYARFAIRLDADTGDSFVFTPYEQGVKFSLQSLLPYWWRRPIKTVNTRPNGLDGARRVGAPDQYIEL